MSRRGGVPSGAAAVIVMGVWGRRAPINLVTGIQVTHPDQRRAENGLAGYGFPTKSTLTTRSGPEMNWQMN